MSMVGKESYSAMAVRISVVVGVLLAGSAAPALGEETQDARIPDVFQRFCIENFPDFVPSSALLADYDATGDDPEAPPRQNATGSNRTWSIPPLAGQSYNMLVQTYFGEVDGEAASGCSLTTSGQLGAPLADTLRTLFPDATTLVAREPAGPGMLRDRFLVEISGQTAVWTLIARDDPPHHGFDITLEHLPPSLIEQMGPSKVK